MKTLLQEIEKLKKSDVKTLVDKRIREFKALGKRNNDDIFCEACFCILTANFNAERGMRIQEEIRKDCFVLTEKQLANRLKQLGYRFPNVRAAYIIESRKHKDKIIMDRDWLVDNIKGLGMKEASHFLRNIGFDDVAIIDFHIVDLLVKYKLIEKPKTITKRKYLEIEEVLRNIAEKSGLTLAELDLYLWYMETGKVLK